MFVVCMYVVIAAFDMVLPKHVLRNISKMDFCDTVCHFAEVATMFGSPLSALW